MTEDKYKNFIQSLALVYEKIGLPGQAARILSYLLICDPAEQSAEDIARAVGGSKGGISMMTRMLEQMVLIEKVPSPGQRKKYWKLRDNVWTDLIQNRINQLSYFVHKADEGLKLLENEPEERKKRLRHMREFYAFFMDDFSNMMAKWEKHIEEDK